MRRWSLESIGTPFPAAQYSFVAPVRLAGGREAVLKVGFVHSASDDIAREIAALTCYDGNGAVALIGHHAPDGALLLARARPGTPLADERDDERATHVAARSMKTLWRAAPTTDLLIPVSLWGQQRLSLERDALPSALDAALAPRAHDLLRELLNAPNKPVLLHGDVHPWNLLRVGDEAYGAIDPKGCYGDPLYEVIAWLRNWPAGLDHFPNPSDAMQKRVEWLSHELGYPVEQIAAWGFAGLFLDAWHDSLRNPSDPYPMHVMRCAALLAPLAT